jgi:flagellar basal body-associated protein FliL
MSFRLIPAVPDGRVQAARKRGRKMLLVGLAILVALAVIATGVGVGVTHSKKHKDKSASSTPAATPTSTPSTAADYTVRTVVVVCWSISKLRQLTCYLRRQSSETHLGRLLCS